MGNGLRGFQYAEGPGRGDWKGFVDERNFEFYDMYHDRVVAAGGRSDLKVAIVTGHEDTEKDVQ